MQTLSKNVSVSGLLGRGREYHGRMRNRDLDGKPASPKHLQAGYCHRTLAFGPIGETLGVSRDPASCLEREGAGVFILQLHQSWVEGCSVCPTEGQSSMVRLEKGLGPRNSGTGHWTWEVKDEGFGGDFCTVPAS